MASERVNVILFAGGRGAGTIIDALVAHPRLKLTVLVNAYDDGLSTGRLRDLLPGMLGPSDIRKNFSRLIPGNAPGGKALQELLEYRFPQGTGYPEVRETLGAFSDLSANDGSPLGALFVSLSLAQARQIAIFSQAFLGAYDSLGQEFDFADCSLGNLFFAGAFLREGRNFNLAIQSFSALAEIPAKILNVTQGEGYVLVGLKEDGTFLRRESEIVGPQNAALVSEIFLLPRYLNQNEELALAALSISKKCAWLQAMSLAPQLNPETRLAIAEADLIIYGPGTQHSSLLPSYLTEGLAEAISENEKAQKVFVANLRRDFEIQRETVHSLLNKVLYYLSRKETISLPPDKIITKYFFQKSEGNLEQADHIEIGERAALPHSLEARGANWELGEGRHLGGKVVEELIALANETAQQKLSPLPYMVSIVVPALNEARTVGKVLHDLVVADFQSLGISKEIIFVDGGSSDGTYELAQKETSVRSFQCKPCLGRGAALRFGADQAQGNIIVFFPSDGEYDVQDLFPVVRGVVKNEFKVVFGSRAIKCVNLEERIREIYRGNPFGYLIGKYGGMVLSVISLLLFNRFVSDPLTGIKAFESRLLHSLRLRSNGLNLESEIIAKLGLRGVFILEVPVSYFPRRKSDGKKTTLWDGLGSLFSLFRYRWSKV